MKNKTTTKKNKKANRYIFKYVLHMNFFLEVKCQNSTIKLAASALIMF